MKEKNRSITLSLTLEEELLLLASRLNLSETQKRRASELIELISDWKSFGNICSNSLLGPFVYSTLIRKYNLKFPAEIVSLCASLSSRVLANNIRVMAEYENLKAILGDANIEFIPLKGVYLLEQHEELFNTRLTSDIDILVSPTDELKVRELLVKENYSERLTLPIKLSQLTLNPTPYNYDRNGITLDLHYRLNRLERFSMDFNLVWSASESADFSSQRNLGDLDRLIHLCIHAYTHYQIYDFKLSGLVDVLIELETLKSWDSLLERSGCFGCAHEVSAMLFLTAKYYDIEIPDEVFSSLNLQNQEELTERFFLFLRYERTEVKEKYHTSLNRFKQFGPLLSFWGKLQFAHYYAFPEKLYLQEFFGSKSSRFRLLSRYLFFQIRKALA